MNPGECHVIHFGRTTKAGKYTMNARDQLEIRGTSMYMAKGPWRWQHWSMRWLRILALISQSMECKSREFMVHLYKTLVRPQLEHGVQFWFGSGKSKGGGNCLKLNLHSKWRECWQVGLVWIGIRVSTDTVFLECNYFIGIQTFLWCISTDADLLFAFVHLINAMLLVYINSKATTRSKQLDVSTITACGSGRHRKEMNSLQYAIK